MGAGAETISVYGDHACVEAYTFDADTLVPLYGSDASAIVVSGFSITISDSTADACPVAIATAEGVPIMKTILPVGKLTAGGFPNVWQVTGLHISVPDGDGLSIFGGASGAVLNAVVFCEELPL